MWEEYAKAHDITTNAMTQAQKIEAEYNGIMQETKFQVGDATAYTRTFGGQIQQLKFNFNQMTVAIGKVVAPIAQLFIPYINMAMQAVTNFFTKIQELLSVFGLKMPNVVSKASSSISDVGSSALDTATNIESAGDSAVSAAKKINRAFGSVDEINVLNTKNSSSKDSGNSESSNASVPITPTVAEDSAVSSAVQATVDKIKKYIEPLKNINFNNLINAFSNLWEALKPFGKTIGMGLEWLYFNVLVPLARWTIEDVLPAFLDLLSGALKVLNPLLQSFGDIFKVIWNIALKPIAEWTGGVIVSVLKGLADVLSKIGNWMSKNKPIVEGISVAVAGFFAAWKTAKFLEYLDYLHKTGGILGTIKTGLQDIKKINFSDKVSAIKDTLTHAKDFLKVIGSTTIELGKTVAKWTLETAAKVANTAATIAHTVATTAATAATWAFNTALTVLKSPITLVIVIITALISIVILLIKHWDDVKNAASKCWEWIVNVWNNAATWFNTTIIQPITNLFGNLWSNLKSGASQAWAGVKNVFSSVGSFFNGIWSTIKSSFSSIGTKIGDAIGGAFRNTINSVLSTVENGINFVPNSINKALNLINKLPGVNISRMSRISLPRLAQGGWVPKNEPQLTIIGDNTREGEIVAPESKIYEQVLKANRDSKNNINNQPMEWHIYVHYEDGTTIIKKINQTQIEQGEILLEI